MSDPLRGWKTVKLSEVCEIIAGQSPKGEFYNNVGDGLPFYQGKKEFGEKFIGAPDKWTRQTTREAYEGDVLMSVRAPVGPINFATQTICIGRGLAAIRANESQLDRDFLYYALLEKQDEIKGNEGAVFASINKKQIGAIEIPLPPLSEQRRIVSVLDAAFAGLATATAHTQKNLQNARELFDSHLKKTFGGSGKGWSTKAVTEFADHCLGKMLDKRKNMGTPRPYLRNINVRWFEFHTSDLLEMRIKDNEIDKYSTKRGDLMICEGGYPGRAAIWDSDDPICFQKAIHRVRSHEPIYNVWLLYYLFYLDSTGLLKDHFTGSGILHFTGRALAKLPVPLPPVAEAKALVCRFEEMRDVCEKLESVAAGKLAALSELKQSLLHRAFRGELS